MHAQIIRKANLIEMFRRKKYQLFVPFLSLMVVTVAVAFLLPIYYKSITTILIEESNIPEGIVEDNFTGFVDQRLDTITQRIMSRTRLWDIIEQYNLYANSRESRSREELVKLIKRRIKIETISSDIFQAGSDMPIRGTISFTLSFEDTDPHVAQDVTNELAALYVQENEAKLEKSLEDTATFLKGERQLLEKRLSILESEIANFKAAHIQEMPERLENNILKISELEDEIKTLEMDLQSLLERKSETEGELMKTKPYSQIIGATGERVMEPEDKLNTLRFEYLKKRATLSPKHPDLIMLKMEIEELEKVVGRRGHLMDVKKHLNNLEAEYIKKSGRLGEKHPDLTVLRSEIEVARKEMRTLESQIEQKQEMNAKEPDNPVYIDLQTTLRTLNLNINTTAKKLRYLRNKLVKYEKRIDKTPIIERSYLNLTREYSHLKDSHAQLLSRIEDARGAQEVDDREKGQRFAVIDEAIFPEKPSKPNIPVLFVLGLIISLSISIGVLYLSEYTDRSIRTASELSAATGQQVLISVPYIHDTKYNWKESSLMIIKLFTLLLLLAATVWAAHHYYITYYFPHTI
jgi:uncharacterized protein involved in exopolysaccharide biosynthesis